MPDVSDYHVTSLPRRRRDNPWLQRALIVVTLILLVDSLFGERGLAETRKARRALAQARVNVAQLKNTNTGLREQARRLSEDMNTIEDVARKELGLIRDGEVMFVLKPAR